MSGLADIYAAVRLALDGTGFEAQATALADKSGKNMGDKMSANLNKALKAAAGAALGAAFQAVSQQARELDAATQKLAADTGLSGAALKAQGQAIADLYSGSLMSMSQVEASLAVVINGLDLTGAAADAMTAKFLKFEEATGQDSAAVSAFHEILNAWSLDASAAPHIMDLLVASHQKYGSSIADNEAMLQKLAPQMIALGMNIEDTVGLLNLFDAAGMDSSRAMFALNTAVKNLKPGQTFNDLVKQVSAIEDPTLRAQEAIKLFGARGGVNLANALKPGITSLNDFKTSTEDTVGATDKAAQAIEDSWGNRITLALHAVLEPLAEVGQATLGPLVLVSMLGPKLAAGIGALATLVLPAVAGLGTATGGAVVAGETAAVAAGGPAVAGAVAAHGAEVGAAAGGLGTMAGAAFGAAILLAIPVAFAGGLNIVTQQFKGMFTQQAQDAGLWSPWSSTPVGEQLKGQTDAQKEAADAQAKIDAAVLAQKIADAPGVFEADNTIAAMEATVLASKKAIIAQAVKEGYSGVPTAIEASNYLARVALLKGLDDQVAAIKSKKSAFTSAWSDAIDASAGPADRALAEYSLRCQMVAPELLKALQSTDATDKKMAKLQLQSLQAQYAKLLADEANYGTKAERIAKLNGLLQSQALMDGLASTDQDTVAMWAKVQADTQTALDTLNGVFSSGGTSLAAAFVAAVVAAMPASQKAIWDLMSQVPTGNPWGSPGGGGSTYSPTAKPYAAGTPFVAYDQLAFLDRGERVVTAADNAALGAGLGGIQIGSVTVNGVGSDVGPAAARRFGQQVADEIAAALQTSGSRFSEFNGSRP